MRPGEVITLQVAGGGSFNYKLSQETGCGQKGHCFINGMSFSLVEYKKMAQRQRNATNFRGNKNRASGFSHPVHGHMNKHLAKMKYLRRKEGIELPGALYMAAKPQKDIGTGNK